MSEKTNKISTTDSPMISHYRRVKALNSDCIILYRLGDFYEMFDDDAILCSRTIGLTLTAKEAGGGKKAPMCGIPAKALDVYLPKFIENGYKVGICEQLTDPKPGKQLVERDLVRIITPGTIVESEMLDSSSNNYLAVLYLEKNYLGVAYLDISTGEFNVCEFDNNIVTNINDLFAIIKPKEVLANAAIKEIENELAIIQSQALPSFNYLDDAEYEYKSCEEVLKNQLQVESLRKYNCASKYYAITAAGALLKYVNQTQKRPLSHINSIKLVDLRTYMQIDSNSRRNLELTENSRDGSTKGTLLSVIDKTRTNMGKRTLKDYLDKPLINETEINYRLNGVEELVRNIVPREQLKELLYKVYDIERLTAKISYNNLTPKDCLSLNASLQLIPDIKTAISSFNSKVFKDIILGLNDYTEVCDILTRAIEPECSSNYKDGGYIRKGFNAQLDEYIEMSTNSSDSIAKLELAEKELTGIKGLKIKYNKVFGYFIEIPKLQAETVPYRYIRKQTIANSERYITQELKEIEDKVLNAADRRLELEQEIFRSIREYLLGKIKSLQQTSHAIGTLDALLSLSYVAVENNYVKPIITKSNVLEIIDGRHPVVESVLHNNFVPNDTILNDTDSRTMLITGPNMAGKSTYMRQVALITILGQIGSFVPAKSAKLGIVDRVFTRIGASDNLMFGQSTFMVEMAEVSNILDNATDRSLVLLDEIGRGTSTFDGLSIAWAVMEYISNHYRCKTLFSTHFHELTELEGLLDGVKNYKVQVKEYNNNVIFLRKIVRGSANQSFGIQVAALAKLPQEVLDRATQILHNLEEHDLNQNLIAETTDNKQSESNAKYRRGLNEIAGILTDLDVNTLTPLSAFDTLIQLKGYINKD